MKLSEAIPINRRKHARYERAEKTLRKIRQRIFDYEDESPAKYQKAQRVMATCQRILEPKYRARRIFLENEKLNSTPSAFEPGLAGKGK